MDYAGAFGFRHCELSNSSGGLGGRGIERDCRANKEVLLFARPRCEKSLGSRNLGIVRSYLIGNLRISLPESYMLEGCDHARHTHLEQRFKLSVLVAAV